MTDFTILPSRLRSERLRASCTLASCTLAVISVLAGCSSRAAVMGDKVLLGSVPMELMDVIVHPRTLQVIPNPESPNIPMFLAK
ncbi:MAG: hypothetical protein WCI96_00765 [Planctomycetota bacterium]